MNTQESTPSESPIHTLSILAIDPELNLFLLGSNSLDNLLLSANQQFISLWEPYEICIRTPLDGLGDESMVGFTTPF